MFGLSNSVPTVDPPDVWTVKLCTNRSNSSWGMSQASPKVANRYFQGHNASEIVKKDQAKGAWLSNIIVPKGNLIIYNYV